MPVRRQVVSASVATAVAFAILVALGVWQVQRLRWKEGILARIAAAERSPPVEVAPGETPPLFERVRVSGTLRGGKVAFFGADVRGDQLGAQEIEVLDRPGAKPVLVDLGWVRTQPAPPPPETGSRTVVGYVRRADSPGLLSAADDVEGRRFYTLQPKVIGPALGAPDAADFVLVALGPASDASGPVPADTLPRPPNNHLQYAFTWFGLAGALLAVFVAWVRGNTRKV